MWLKNFALRVGMAEYISTMGFAALYKAKDVGLANCKRMYFLLEDCRATMQQGAVVGLGA